MLGSARLVKSLALVSVLAIVGLAVVPTASAPAFAATRKNVVLEWNLHAATALINPSTAATPGAGQTPPVAELHLAMVHGAVYDAVNSIHRGFKPYLAGLPSAPKSASKQAAAATAAHHVLVGMSPALPDATKGWLDERYAESLEVIDAGPATNRQIARGTKAGAAAAQKMLEVRAEDGRYSSFSFTEGTQPGQWRRTTPDAPTDPFAWVAKVEPFTLTSQSQFRSTGPLALDSVEYAQEYNEVKTLGGNGTTTPTTRTPEQTELASFYTANPVEMFNRTFRTIAEDRGLSIVEQARFFARLHLTGADSFINCWDDKAYWNVWRPITAIRLGDTDGNDATEADPEWTSMVPSPPYPDHPSGYNCITGGLMHAAKRFFKTDEVTFSVVKIAPNTADVTRSYERFTDVARDTIDARVFLGIHFRTPDVQGAVIGQDVARWVDRHFFKKIKN
ncbi:MAG TPA: hypothetical protein VE174_11660 [Actinomycetota bacterium]|nr:hypothetical protein [Actinomycetota bacterium]